MSNEEKYPIRYGSFILIPLKYDALVPGQIEQIGAYRPLTTMDLNENIKAMLDRTNEAAVGARYAVERAALTGSLGGAADPAQVKGFRVTADGKAWTFDLHDGWLYVFHTQVAFLCLSLSFGDMEALKAICNPGSAHNAAAFDWLDARGEAHPFSMEEWLGAIGAPLGLRKFFDGPSSYLLDAYTYIFALTPQRFETLEEMQRITFQLHKMLPPDATLEDTAEEDIRYVYAVREQVLRTYRWGCCVASQTISYVTADAGMDFAAEQAAQAEDGLPVVLLSLYEKYTCLRFTERITHLDKGRSRELKALKDMMLRFQAFGTVTPANLSRWHNVKQIYANLLEVNDIAAAVQDISSKLTILTEHQQAIERSRSETVVNIITLFGIVSILASVLSIVQILGGGDRLIWASTILTTAALALITVLALRNKRK